MALLLLLSLVPVLNGEPLDDLFRPERSRLLNTDISSNSTTSQLSTTIPGLLRPQARDAAHPPLARQEKACAYPVPCQGNTWCCPAGSQCCSTFLDCCPTNSNCRSDRPGYCCPKSAQTCGGKFCAPPGSVCCGTSYVCPQGQQCNTNGGGKQCCEAGELHCNDACCPSGSTCASIPGYCSSIRTTTQTRTTTSTSTFRSTGTITTASGLPSTTGCSPASNAARLLEARQRPFPDFCTRLCNVASRQELPVWELDSVVGETDQLVYSMCYGIVTRQRAGLIQNGLADGEDVLEYNGKGVRNEADCAGYCQDVSAASGLGVGSFQCDEYPPATLNPVSGLQTRWCVPRYQNSGTQGPMLSKFLRKCGVNAKDKVLVKIKGGCNKYNFPRELPVNAPAPRADSFDPAITETPAAASPSLERRKSTTVKLDASNATLRNPYGDSSLTYVAVEIDELADGDYTFEVSLSGGSSIDNVTILNKYGETYANLDSPGATAKLSFTINDGSNLPAALIAWTTQAVNVTYTGSGTLSNSTSGNAIEGASGSWWMLPLLLSGAFLL
ncbi:hypothetical protein MIND_01415100 [Mycena indigotica]|uniref:Deoxyribonuclease NucA/NucB domain-containing protein n=1 Tax=Mycena indigotica TaxID=2126181 RepID=A0A8H6VUR9_9AGAR|nr:uncharacterized protein MIND_01415100 [Mycena indigotica]KAF7288984.1 hypothetical protein MIND_01415100 [Mycena indigotica]